MALTIVTKYLSSTNCKGARIKVSCSNGASKAYSYDHAASEPHALAVWCFLNDVFDVNSVTISQQETLMLPIAGLAMDSNGVWFTNSSTLDNKGYTIIIDSIDTTKWMELKVSGLL